MNQADVNCEVFMLTGIGKKKRVFFFQEQDLRVRLSRIAYFA